MSAKRILLVLVGLVSLGLIAVVVVFAGALPRWVERRVVAEANARGFELRDGDISFGWQWVQVTDAKVTLLGVPGLSADVGVIDVQLAGFEPQRIAVGRVSARASGELGVLLSALDSWRAAHAKDLRAPLTIKPFSFTLAAGEASALAFTNGELSLSGERVVVRAPGLTALGRELGAFSAQQEPASARLALTLNQGPLENPTLSVEQSRGAARTLHLALAPIALGKLSKVLGLELPLPDTVLSGTIDVKGLDTSAPLSRASGALGFILKGYIPPHPVELDGFVFGDTTELGSSFILEPERLGVRFADLRVKAGQFALRGAGGLRLEGDHGRLTAELAGSLPCGALAAAAAESRLGRALGRLTGKAALQTLNGAVGVRVAVDADTRQLDKARVVRTITPGCGLKPLTLAELQALGELAPGALAPAMLRDFETLLKNPLPPLPNLGPGLKLDLPALPQLPLVPAPAASAGAKGGAAKGSGSAGRSGTSAPAKNSAAGAQGR